MGVPTKTQDEVAAASGSAHPEEPKYQKLSELKPLKLFLEPHLFCTHFLQAIGVLWHAAATYILLSGMGVLLFTGLYMIFGHAEYAERDFFATAYFFFKKSVKVYWGYGEWRATRMGLLETIYRDCVGVCMLGKIVTGMMIPNNPIEFSNFFIVTDNQQIKLRYWIMLPVGSLLHNPRLRVMLIEDRKFYEGDGTLKARYKKGWEYSGIRGVRSLTLDEKTSKTILKGLRDETHEYKMVFMISGGLVEGRQYFSEKRYTLEDMLYADDYLSIRKENCSQNDKIRKNLPDKIYINFNMAYKNGSKPESEAENKTEIRPTKDSLIYFRPTKHLKKKKLIATDREITKIILVGTGEDWHSWVLGGHQGRINKLLNKIILRKYDNLKPEREWLKNKINTLKEWCYKQICELYKAKTKTKEKLKSLSPKIQTKFEKKIK